jgi:hypothetical protein
LCRLAWTLSEDLNSAERDVILVPNALYLKTSLLIFLAFHIEISHNVSHISYPISS